MPRKITHLRQISLAVFASLIAFSPMAQAFRDFDASNNPGNVLAPNYETRIGSLPQSGSIPYKLWSDTYWPNRFGGAGWRWQTAQTPGSHPESDPHNYRLYSQAEIQAMTSDQIAQLSPAEKYDIITGRYDFPTVRKEIARTNPDDPKSNGLCHAVAAATSQFLEPRNKIVTVPRADGSTFDVIMYASDIKALLALAVNQVVQTTSDGVGQNCHSTDMNSASCWDTNPGAFYIALTNMVGVYQRPLLMDVDPGPEVWNAVIKSYSAKITDIDEISPYASRATAREVRVDMTLQHTLGVKPARDQVGAAFKTETYAFTLELDSGGNIVGGEWISKNRPDSLWKPEDHLQLDPSLSFVSQLTTPLN